MTRLIYLSLFILFSSYSLPENNSANYIKVIISGITEDGGNIRLGIFNSPDGFPVTGSQYKGFEYPVKNKKVHIYMKDIPKGNYSIGVMHDVNENGKLDKNFIGYPTEKYGFSNDARGTFSAPSYESARFYHDGSTTMTIKIY